MRTWTKAFFIAVGILVSWSASSEELGGAKADSYWTARNYFGSAVHDGKIWVVGGYNGSALRDVWRSADGASWTLANSTPSFSARWEHATAEYNGKLWVLGGYNGTTLHDVWSSVDGVTWSQATAAAGWSVRLDHASVAYNGKLWVLGGYPGLNDVWNTTDGAAWTQTTSSAGWSARYGHAAVVFNNAIYIMGGYAGSAMLNDVWKSTDGVSWNQVTANAPWGPRYYFGAVAYNGLLWVIGGSIRNGRANDVWSSADGVTWEKAATGTRWQPRSAFGCVADSRGIWVLGGSSSSSGSTVYLDDVWFSTDGADWTALRKNTPPTVPFIGTNAGVNFTTAGASLTLTGFCGCDVAGIRVNGSPIAYTRGAMEWATNISLSTGANTYSVTAVDDVGNASAATSIAITLNTAYKAEYANTRPGPCTEPVNFAAYQQIRYVDGASGVDNPWPYAGSATAPWKTLSYAIGQITNASNANRYALLVASGVYSSTVALKSWVDLYGGFEMGTWIRDIFGYRTKIQNNGATSAMTTAANARLDGCYLLRNSGNSVGVYVLDGAEISNCIITGHNGSSSDHGGGLRISGGSNPSLIRNNCIYGNSPPSGLYAGGALFSTVGGVVIRDNLVFRNSAYSAGGIYLSGKGARATNNLILANTASYTTGGAYALSATTLSNNWVAYNSGTSATGVVGGIVALGALASSNTVIGNSGYASSGGIAVDGILGDPASICANNIVWNSAAGAEVAVFPDSAVRNSCLLGGYAGPGNTDADPVFLPSVVDTTTGALYNADTLCTTFRNSGFAMPQDRYTGRPIKVNGSWTVVAANTRDSISVWGNYNTTGTFTYEILSPALEAGSSCRNTANMNGAPFRDWLGHYRPQESAADIGAVESGPFLFGFSTDGGNGPGVDFSTNGASITLQGFCPADAQGVRINGSANGVIYSPGTTTWSWNGTLAEGVNNLVLTLVNTAGDYAGQAVLHVTLDSTAPAAPIITTNNGANFTWLTSAAGTPLNLAGTCASDTETLLVNNSSTGVTYNTNDIAWAFTETKTPGVYTYQVVSVDAAGNKSAPDTITVTVVLDDTPPAAPVITTNGGNGAGVNFTQYASSVTLQGTCAADTVSIKVNNATTGVAYTPGATSWSFSNTALVEGANTFSVTAVDSVGNVSSADTIIVTRDTTAPPAPIIGTNAGLDFTIPGESANLGGVCAADVAIIKMNGVAISHTLGETTWTVSAPLAEGANPFSFTAQDGVGNTSAATVITVTRNPAYTFSTEPIGPRNEEIDLSVYPPGNIHYIDSVNGQDLPGHGTRTSPWQTLTYAFTQITTALQSDRHCILVPGGDYTYVFTGKAWIDLFGGYETANWTRNIFSHRTRMIPASGSTVITLAGNSRLDGFYITRGAQECRGIGCAAGNVISNCVIYGHYMSTGEGCAISGSGSTQITVRNCTVANNVVYHSNYGEGFGVVYIAAPLWLQACIIANNFAPHTASVSAGGPSVILNNMIIDNRCTSTRQDTRVISIGTGKVLNNVLMFNVHLRGYHWAGPYGNWDSSYGTLQVNRATVVHNTLAYNTTYIYDAEPDQRYVTPCVGVSTAGLLANNILWNPDEADEAVTCNHILNNCATETLVGTGNITSHPQFAQGYVDGAASAVYDPVSVTTTFSPTTKVLVPDELKGLPIMMGTLYGVVSGNTETTVSVWGNRAISSPFTWEIRDYHLSGTSPCLDSGTPIGAAPEDLEGQLRPTGYGYDMGADESGRFKPGMPDIAIAPTSPYTGDDLVCNIVTPSLVGEGLTPKYEYVWSCGGIVITHGPKVNLSDTLDAAYTTKHEVWRCAVRCWDGGEFSADSAVDSVTILNTPPGELTLSLPSQESDSVNLRCAMNKAADPDADVVYAPKWFLTRGGAEAPWTGPVLTTADYTQIDTVNTLVGDRWRCEVTYGDGETPNETVATGTCEILGHGTLSSYISLGAASNTVTLGEPVTILGQIFPPPNPGASVFFRSTSPSGDIFNALPEGMVISGSSYSRQFYPTEASEGRSDWSLISWWPGDATYMPAESDLLSLTVLKSQPALSLSITPGAILANESEVTATATLSASLPDVLKPLLANQPIKLYLRKPDGTSLGPVLANTDANGVATFSASAFAAAGIAFSAPGTWQLLAEFDESQNFLHATSPNYDTPQAARLTVKDGAGYAIVVVGKLNAGAEGHASHCKTADFVYRAMRDRGFAPEDICYFREGPVQPQSDIFVDDTTPTKSEVQQAITSWALNRMNETPAPLYIVMLDHGGADSFYVYSGSYDPAQRVIAPPELSSWLDTMQSGLEGAARTQDIVLVDGACHSGSFIDEVSGAHRTIITSSAASEISHRGVKDPANVNDVRDGEPFVTELFRGLREGKTLKASFEKASQQIETFTASRSNGIGPKYVPQHPQLDDNGDGLGVTWSNLAYESGYDGANAHSTVLGFGVNAGEDIGWIEASKTIVAGPADPIELFARATVPGSDYAAWIEVKTPEYAGAEPADATLPEYQQVVAMPRFNYEPAISDISAATYRWRDGFGNLFDTEGTYKIYYYIKAPDTAQKTGETSTYLLTTVYRLKADNQPPAPVDLTYPDEAANVPAYSFFAWTESTDPDGDPVVYRFELARDAAFTEGLLCKEDIQSAFFQVTALNPDLGPYYWRVIPVDQYGASPALNPSRTVLFTGNPSIYGSLSGRVTDAATGAPIKGVTITLRKSGQVQGSAITDGRGEFFRGQLPPGTYAIEAAKQNYANRTVTATVFEDNNSEQDIEMAKSGGSGFRWGELSGDGRAGTVDASMISQWRVRLINEFPAYPGVARPAYPNAGDVNADGALNELDASDLMRWKVGLNANLPADCDSDEFGPDSGCKRAETAQKKTERRVSLPNLTANPAEDLTVDVAVDDASGARGYLLDITYDAAVLEYLDLQKGSLTAAWGLPTANAQPGEVILSGYGTTALTGSGSLIVLRFRVRAEASGRTSPLHLVTPELNGIEIPVNPIDGSVTVTGPLPEGEDTYEGTNEGATEGNVEGTPDGASEGQIEGFLEGAAEEGASEGTVDGQTDGGEEGLNEGAAEGAAEGTEEGGIDPMPFACNCNNPGLFLKDLKRSLGDLFLLGLGAIMLACASAFTKRT